jgi:hypothetical protein
MPPANVFMWRSSEHLLHIKMRNSTLQTVLFGLAFYQGSYEVDI